MSRLHILGAGAALTLLLATSTAGASTIYVTYEGLISQGTDADGLFGTPGGVLDGQHFTARFQLDTDMPGTSTYNPPLSSSFNWVNVFDPPVADPSITINNHTFEFFAGSADAATINHSNSAGGVWGVSTSISSFSVDTSGPTILYNEDMSLFLRSLVDPFVTNYDYAGPLFHTFQLGDTSGGSLHITETSHVGEPNEGLIQNVSADLTPLSVRVAVPEPGAWLLMIAGFGLAGAALRRRRHAATAPA